MAAPVYASVGTFTNGASGSSCNANKPAGTADGDLLIMIVTIEHFAAYTVTTPSGWTRIVNNITLGGGTFAYIFWKVAASEPSTWTVSASGSVNWYVNVAQITGGDATTPVGQVATQTNGAGTTIVCPTVTTTGADRMIACITYQAHGNNVTPPGTLTERFDRTSSGTVGQAFGDTTQAVAGATGTFTWTQPSATRTTLGVTIEIAPTAGPPPSTFVPQITIT